MESPITEANFETGNHFGYLFESDRTPEQNAIDAEIVAGMAPFGIVGASNDDVKSVRLWEFSRRANGGNHFPTFRQITGSCFRAGVPVRMADGTEKPIESIRVGDEVITHTGKKRRVVETMTRQYSGRMITIQLAGYSHPLEMTEDHRVAVMSGKNSDGRWFPERLNWVKASELSLENRAIVSCGSLEEDEHTIDIAQYLEGEFESNDEKILMHRCREKNACNRWIKVNESFARLVGIYLAEGGVHEGRITITLNNSTKLSMVDEVVELVKEIFDVDCVTIQSKPSVITVRIQNKTLATFFKNFVQGNVYTKRVPGVFWNSTASVKKSLVMGWMAGDGHRSIKKNRGVPRSVRIQGVSVCEGLIRDMFALGVRCGFTMSCDTRKANKQSKQAYNLYFGGAKALNEYPELKEKAHSLGIGVQETRTDIISTGVCKKVKKIASQQVTDLTVYDFEVEEDHSFIANGIVVHNCVGNGGGQAVWYLSAVEVIRLGDPEQVLLPFYLLPYGRSRHYAGLRGRGEGSFGSAFAKAIVEDGILPFDTAGLPRPEERNGITWGREEELRWSDGAAISETWLQQSRKYLVKSAARIRNKEEAGASIRNYYPFTIASSWGGMMSPPIEHGVRLNTRVTTWHHQMVVIGWQEHERLGELFYVLNSWGPTAHGSPAGDEPPGGFWIRASEMDWICKTGECYAFSQFQGFPAQHFNWLI